MNLSKPPIMNPDIAARLDSVCDSFEQAWKSGTDPDIASFLASQVDDDIRCMALPLLIAVDAEYRRARDGSAPTPAEYAALLGIDPGELQQMSAEDTWMASAAPTPILGDLSVVAGMRPDRAAVRLGAGIKPPEIKGYEILSELGRGGMGVVYKARQIRAGRLVALKTIHSPHLAGTEQVLRFQAEAAAAARLTHHGIVPVYDVGECNGLHYFSMGFVDGPTLEVKARAQVLSCREAATLCRDLAEALEYAHRNGVIHRDVKPHNVLIGADGKPRLTDFGLAKLIDENQDVTGTGQVMGTAAYMAPEQARGIRTVAGPTIDVYSLGATLYRCVTGRPPFQASTTIEVLRQLHEDEPVSPRRLNQEVDVEIETLCSKCLEKEPWRRFQTAGELAAELNRYLNREPIQSRPISAVARAWRWCLRRPASAASILMGVLLLTVMAAAAPMILLQQNRLQLAELQRQRDVDARGKAESAHEAEEQSRKQAEKLAAANAARAATQEYFVSIMKVREMRMQPEPKAGWTWEALDLLENAAASNADGKDPVALRSLIADTLATPDMLEIGRLEGVPNTHALAVSHDGKLLAAGDWAGNPSQVRIYRIHTTTSDKNRQSVQFELIRVCEVSTIADYIESELIEKGWKSGTTRREGMWAIDFSPDDTNIAVGTRNGNITIWKIDCEPPQILFDKRYPEKGTDRLMYTQDGRQIIVDHRNPATLRVFDVETQSDRTKTFDEDVDFGLLPDGGILACRDGFVSRLTVDSFTETVEFEVESRFTHVGTDLARSVAIVGTAPAAIFDPVTHERTLILPQLASEPNRAFKLIFAADTTLVLATHEPQNVRLWDALSGRQMLDISYPGYETPLICAGRERDRIYVYSIVNTFAYQLRCSQPVQDRSEASPLRHTEADLRQIGPPVVQTHVDSPGSLAHAVSPVSAFVPGAQVLCDFALSDDQQQMAVVEAASVRGLHTIPDGYRARLRTLSTNDGAETARWTCLHLSSGEHRNTLTEGDAVTFLDDDSVRGAGQIAFTTPALGNIVAVSSSGFYFPSGIGLNVQQSDPVVTAADTATWTGGEVPAVSETIGFRPAIELKLPRALTQSKERLLIRLIIGENIREYEVSGRHLDSAGWHLLFLDQFEKAFESGTWQIEASLVESSLHFDSHTANAQKAKESAIQVGHLFLMPWKRLKRGQTAPVYPQILGPLSRRSDNGLAAIVEGYTLYQWSSNLSGNGSAFWRDVANNEQAIEGLSQSEYGFFVGTNSGLVALVKPDGSEELVAGAETTNGSFDPRDGVLATAVADSADLAVAGTLQGQIKVYNLTERTGTPTFVTDAHSREIVCLAITHNGQLLASADAAGALRFWKRHADRLELLFEMTANRSPIVTMQFSRDGDLYLLRRGDRGVLRLELDELAAHFRNCGLAMPD